MDNDFNESDLGSNNSGSSFNGFGDIGGSNSADKQKDINNINERTGKNKEPRRHGRNRDSEDDDETNNKGSSNSGSSKRSRGSDLDSDSTEEDSKDKDSSSDAKGEGETKEDKDSKSEGDTKADSKEKDAKGDGFLKSKFKAQWAKYKIYFIVAGVALGVFVLAFLFLVIITAIDNLTLGLVSFFGVPESTKEETGNLEGLYDDDKYRYDENGNLMNRQELIDYLERNKGCEGNFWTSLKEGWSGLWDLDIEDPCELFRHIENKSKDGGYNIDVALIYSTVFYGYDTMPKTEFYLDPNQAPESTPALEHYQNLAEMLGSKNVHIKRSDIDKIIEYSHAKSKSYYYKWDVAVEKDEKTDKVTKVVGSCQYKETTSDKYNLDKWKVFMRFGEEPAKLFEEVVLKAKNFEASDDECKNADDAFTEAVLQEEVNQIAKTYGADVVGVVNMGSVNKAREVLEKPDANASEVFYQAADLTSKTKDYFSGYNGVAFDYKNGYAYNHFPSFHDSMDPDGAYYGKVRIEYDDIFTPKEVEQVIQNIVARKTNMNYALNKPDPDVIEDYTSTLNGYTGVPTGANCMQYLTASLDEIQVDLTDCWGNPMATVPFPDYIIGVANGEVSNRNDDYVLSQMVASISYALRRRNNYTKGNRISMRSGNCDQVYCSMMKGCTSKSTPINGDTRFHSYYIGGNKAYPQLYPKYQALYEIASDYLIVKDGAPFNSPYINTTQNRWYAKTQEGKSFTQIIQEEYEGAGATLIKCSDDNSTPAEPDTPTEEEEKKGNKATAEYPSVAPDKGIYYGFSYKDGSDNKSITINPDWKNANLVTVSPVCSGNSEYASKKYVINKKALNSFEKAFKGVCKLLTTGIKISNGQTCKYTMSDIKDGTVFIERKTTNGTFDLHPYGIAQDINYTKSITVNGKTYKPYNTRELSDYYEFVNAIGGKEEDCRNVNYILWAYAYKDAGFYWGGNYGRNGSTGSYDGKLFELKYK